VTFFIFNFKTQLEIIRASASSNVFRF